jgi:hypothetical protein
MDEITIKRVSNVEITLNGQDLTDITVALFREAQAHREDDNEYSRRCSKLHDKIQDIRRIS